MKRSLWFILAFVLVVACRPISRGPNPYAPASPLAMLSPLYARGEAPAIEMASGLVAPDDYRAGTIPTALPVGRYKLYAPITAHQKAYPCYTNAMSAELLRLMIEDRAQQRPKPHCSDLVTKIAQSRADDMVRRGYFSHWTPEGHGSNFFLAQVGCLPAWYPQDGNTVESITLNYRTPQASWDALVASRGHRPHVLGMHLFFAAQVAIGTGYATGDWGTVFVVISVPQCD